MSGLARLDSPGRVRDLGDDGLAAWSSRVSAIFAAFSEFAQLYDPTVADTPDGADIAEIVWTAFPARLLRGATSQEGRWRTADEDRKQQDEYCEWSVERNAAHEIERVTFTCEVPEYYEELARAPQRLTDLYSQLVGETVAESDLIIDGRFVAANKWNESSDRRLAHLQQTNNTLGAAVDLVAKASVPREDHGKAITSKQVLAQCAGLGDEFRNSDPQIAASVNAVARAGDEITLLDPIGLYINGLDTTDMKTPNGADPAQFWTVERGDADAVVRARFEVPEIHRYNVSAIRSGGRPITFGAQLADRVSVRISAVIKPGEHHPQAQPCHTSSG